MVLNCTHAEIFDVYLKDPNAEEYTKAVYVPPIDFLDVKTGQNEFYNPDLNQLRFFWTRLGMDVVLLPAIALSYWFSYRPNIVATIETDGYGGDTDLDIPTEHLDLLLSLACAEAYLDIGQIDLVNAYKSDAGEQLAILTHVSDKQEKKDTDEER